MLTGRAVQVFESLEQAADVLIQPLRVFEPRKETHEQYRAHYRRYRKLYAAVRPLMNFYD
jgi:xylulokinase